MQRRGVVFLFVLLVFGILVSGVIIAQDLDDVGDDNGIDDTNGEELESDFVSGSEGPETITEVDVIEELIEDAEAGEFDADADAFEGKAGLTSNNPILQFVDGFSDSREEAIAEMEKTAEECSQEGDQGSCEYFKHALKKYEDHVATDRREASPDRRVEEEERVKRNIGRVVRNVAKYVDPGEKDEFVRALVKGEDGVGKAHAIVAAIDELCETLIVELGAHEEAESAGCFSRGDDDYKYLEGRRAEWTDDVSADVKKLLEIVGECNDLTDDDIEGNWKECRCDELGGKLELLCFGIAENEDQCDLPKYDDTELEDFYCDKADVLVIEFMTSLPEDVRRLLEDEFSNFEEDDFDRHGGGPECAGLDFRDCMLREAEKHIQQIPDEECRERVREGIRSGDVTGRRDAEEIIMECMFDKFAPDKCKREGLSPKECGRYFGGDFGGRGAPPGPGFDYTVCDAIDSTEAQLACYKDNVKKSSLAGDYYGERERFRFEEDFDPRRFDREFKEGHRDEYVDFYGRDYRYGRTEEEAYADSARRRAEHEEEIRDFIDDCSAKEGAWDCSFADVTPNEPCRCFKYDYDDYGGYDYGDKGDYGGPNYDCTVMYCGEGYCDPYLGCVSGDGEYYEGDYSPPPEGDYGPYDGYDGGYGGDGGGGSGYAVYGGGFITGNPFLDYYSGRWR